MGPCSRASVSTANKILAIKKANLKIYFKNTWQIAAFLNWTNLARMSSTQLACLKPRINERAKWFANCSEQFANQMHVFVDGTANLRYTVWERFAYRSLDASGVLCSPQVRGKLTMRRKRTAQRVSSTLVYTKLKHIDHQNKGIWRWKIHVNLI